ncbi:MAG: DNA ligase [Desulfuromonas sp.]|nr:DNA ligase [Desulfuromonas sp.]
MAIPPEKHPPLVQWAIVLFILPCLLFLSLTPATAQQPTHTPMLPQTYSDATEVSGWLMSEKLDGVRGYWDGHQLWSKNGHRFYPPAEFTRNLPPFAIEGELWGGRDQFEQTTSIVRRQQPHPGWLELKLAIFDVPQASGGFQLRIEQARQWFEHHPSRYAFVIEQIPVVDQHHLQQQLHHIEQLGGEGLIVRHPNAGYERGRSTTILKVKSYQDSEATVVAQLPGKGRNQGRLGALLVELKNGTRLKIGSGFSDAERESPPAIGSIITFKHYGFYASGLPKFPVYLRPRVDHGL